MNHLYIEPFSGMAGDMFLAALIDLGDPRFGIADLRAIAEALVPGECRIEIENVWRQNLSGRMLSVHTSESEKAPHRGYRDIETIVRASRLARSTQDRALAVFWRIALAEGKVHGCPAEEIHFHEVGAVDTIVDVCGACFALERLEIERVWSSPPVTGTGTVRCAHGEMPVPAPAVAELVRGREVSISGGGGERLTPTGAALLVEFCPTFEAPGSFTPEAIGYGAGHRDPKVGPPNILRVQLARASSRAQRASPSSSTKNVWQVDVNLDDMTGEELATAAEALRAAGALDVWMTNVLMKKGRPGVVLSALCRADGRAEDSRRALETALFEHTSTLGMRWSARERTESGRRSVDIVLDGQPVRVKVRERPNGSTPPSARDLSPEHDDLAELARSTSLSIRELERRAIDAALAVVHAQAKSKGASDR